MPRRRTETGPTTTADAIRLAHERLLKGVTKPNIYGYVPHAKQLDFHQSDARKKLYIGGNRSGKTYGGIAEDVFWLRREHPFRALPQSLINDRECRGRIVTTSFSEGVDKIAIPLVKQFMPTTYFRGGSWETGYDKQSHTLYLKDGGFVEFMTFDQELDQFAGTSRHFIHFDEEPPKSIYNECMARLIDTAGSWWMTMTPVEGMTWIYNDLFLPAEQGEVSDVFIVIISIFDNPHISAEEVETLGSLWDGEEASARMHGRFEQFGGRIYPSFGDINILPEGWSPGKHWPVYVSMDHGLSNLTVFLWHAVEPDLGRIITFGEHYGKEMTVMEHAVEVLKKNRELGVEPVYYVGDPSIKARNPITMTSVWEEYLKYGINIMEGNNDVRAGIIKSRRLFSQLGPDERPMWLITKDCQRFIWEMPRYRWARYAHKKTAEEHNAKEVPRKKDDHAVDAARYFVMSQPELGGQIEVPIRIGNIFGAPVAGGWDIAKPRNQMNSGGWNELGTQWEFEDLSSF